MLLPISLVCRKIPQLLGFRSCIQAIHTMDHSYMLKTLKGCKPPLDNSRHKGQAGRIGIVGGSLEYTGAPYFAGISALKVGADLVHIFCASPAATVIKSYSPELIVHPLLDQKSAITEIAFWFDRLHAIVIGPGLGRQPEIFQVVTELIETIKVKKIPLVIDADGLFLITENPHILDNFSSPVILTPNKIEYERLTNKLDFKSFEQYITILKKGANDEFLCKNPEITWTSDVGGSGRRCGGQGDLLSGSIATLLHWNLNNANDIKTELPDRFLKSAAVSCYGASSLVRLCNKKAFALKGRSMLASDMIEHIHEAFEELFGQ
ncbi:ATP-dependent (S)-NAD(P)H-hydrate dehydratase [Manduca sexta]|uniref:ATP-dependent (S)-NAD(P)H-hydrate dehydratase n=1 Tax=Manduca sexta TaxID=7130 RepID=UPI00188E707A|nr:ATP-dependent (S)-NAD(P)H-hydrate dehydratase [Manduca sexta]